MPTRQAILGVLILLTARAGFALEYPIAVGTHAIFDAHTTVVGQFPTRWRYELWVIDKRKDAFDAVWAIYSGVGQPNETLAGAVPLTMKADGSKTFPMERQATYSLQEQVESFVPTLPPQFDNVWRGPPSTSGWYCSYQPVEVLADRVRCSFAQYGVDKIDQIAGMETVGEVYFDTRFNWMRELSFTTKQPMMGGAQFSITQAKITLAQVLQRDEKWAAEHKEEAKDFFNVLKEHDETLLKANDRLSDATINLSPTLNLWQKFLEKSVSSRFHQLAKNQYGVLQASIPSLQQIWSQRKSVVGAPSPAWTLKDTQGGTYALQSFPNPILLVFWTRTSWWSLMAIRDLKEFQTEFQGKGLLILPINVDNADQDAIQALTAMGSSVVTLRNTDPNLVMAYGIPLGMYPSSVLIGKDKKIFDVRYGWGNQVKQELKKRIEDLL